MLRNFVTYNAGKSQKISHSHLYFSLRFVYTCEIQISDAFRKWGTFSFCGTRGKTSFSGYLSGDKGSTFCGIIHDLLNDKN